MGWGERQRQRGGQGRERQRRRETENRIGSWPLGKRQGASPALVWMGVGRLEGRRTPPSRRRGGQGSSVPPPTLGSALSLLCTLRAFCGLCCPPEVFSGNAGTPHPALPGAGGRPAAHSCQTQLRSRPGFAWGLWVRLHSAKSPATTARSTFPSFPFSFFSEIC